MKGIKALNALLFLPNFLQKIGYWIL